MKISDVNFYRGGYGYGLLKGNGRPECYLALETAPETLTLSLQRFSETEKGVLDSEETLAVFCKETQEVQIVTQPNKLRFGYEARMDFAGVQFLVYIYEHAKNPTVASHILEMYRKTLASLNEDDAQYLIWNLIRYYNDMEYIEAIGESMFNVLKDPGFVLDTEAKQRHKILNLPKGVIAWISEQGQNLRADLTKAFLRIQTNDPNELLELVEYFRMMQQLIKKYDKSYETSPLPLLEKLALMKDGLPQHRLKKVALYLHKQILNDTEGVTGSYRYDVKAMIHYPIDEASTLLDYLQTEPTILLPRNLYKAHDIAMIEAWSQRFSDENKERFAEYGRLLSETHNDRDNLFEFRVPTDYDRFLLEVEPFLNCLKICGEPFMNGQCDIVLVYRQGESMPTYAFETDKDGMILQAKGYHDIDLHEEDISQSAVAYEQRLIKRLKQRKEPK